MKQPTNPQPATSSQPRLSRALGLTAVLLLGLTAATGPGATATPFGPTIVDGEWDTSETYETLALGPDADWTSGSSLGAVTIATTCDGANLYVHIEADLSGSEYIDGVNWFFDNNGNGRYDGRVANNNGPADTLLYVSGSAVYADNPGGFLVVGTAGRTTDGQQIEFSVPLAAATQTGGHDALDPQPVFAGANFDVWTSHPARFTGWGSGSYGAMTDFIEIECLL